MGSWDRRQFFYGSGTLVGSTLLGCGDRRSDSTDSPVTVFENSTVLPVDAAFSEPTAFAILGNRVLAVGSLESVKLADFVGLEDDPRRVESTEISEVGISETWMDGNRVFAG